MLKIVNGVCGILTQFISFDDVNGVSSSQRNIVPVLLLVVSNDYILFKYHRS